MKTPEIIRDKKTIVVSKEFYKQASFYGSNEYNMLVEIQAAHPSFKIVVKSFKKNDPFKNLTLEFMAAYIKEHDADGSIKKNFEILSGTKEGEDGKLGKVSFFELKEWFLNTYPEIQYNVDQAKKRSSDLLEAAKKNAKSYREAKEKAVA
jgi:hypothetical protein